MTAEELQYLVIFRDLDNFKEEKSLWEETMSEFYRVLTKRYSEKTFCIQTDYDYMFGNISWQKAYFYYADAENAILKDWAGREGQPHYTIDNTKKRRKWLLYKRKTIFVKNLRNGFRTHTKKNTRNSRCKNHIRF